MKVGHNAWVLNIRVSLTASTRFAPALEMGGTHPQFFFGPDQDELAYPADRMVLDTTSRNQGSKPSGATMIPKMTVVADLTRSADSLSLKPGYAVGDCHTHRLPTPSPCPTNNFVLKKYGPNRSVRWTRRSVRATILQNGGNTSLGTRHLAHSKHKAMETSN